MNVTGVNAYQSTAAALILIADDSHVVRKILRRYLETHGYRVAEALDGIEAVAVCRDMLPDAVLLDGDMPNLDGEGVLKVLKAEPALNRIPVIFLASSEASARQAVSEGAHSFLIKGSISAYAFGRVMRSALAGQKRASIAVGSIR